MYALVQYLFKDAALSCAVDCERGGPDAYDPQASVTGMCSAVLFSAASPGPAAGLLGAQALAGLVRWGMEMRVPATHSVLWQARAHGRTLRCRLRN